MLEPALFTEPVEGFLAACRDMAHRLGALLIFDEMILGARAAWGGFMRAATLLAGQGSFAGFEAAPPGAELNALFAGR